MSDLKLHPIVQRYIEWNAFGRLLGMDFEIPESGKVIYRMTVTENHLATPIASHGGAIAALLDAALGVACLSKVCEQEKIVSTVAMNIQFMAPALLNDELITTAEVTKAGNRILFAEAVVKNASGDKIAAATATMNAYPVEKAQR
ncbi:MAG TPA: PaaI family thioesterase [Fluviicola sp.]|nr:PaaI family thioesterase [Fluviicola sp.]